MPSITSGNLLTWIVIVFGVGCIAAILVATKGNGFRKFWQLVKIDLLVRNICIAWVLILLFQFINVLLENPWRGLIVLAGAFLNLVMIIVISYILPGRMVKSRL